MSVKPVAWGMPNSSITGRDQPLTMVRLEIPSDDQYGGKLWVPLYSAPAPELAEALQHCLREMSWALDKSVGGPVQAGGLFEKARDEGRQLLARITPK